MLKVEIEKVQLGFNFLSFNLFPFPLMVLSDFFVRWPFLLAFALSLKWKDIIKLSVTFVSFSFCDFFGSTFPISSSSAGIFINHSIHTLPPRALILSRFSFASLSSLLRVGFLFIVTICLYCWYYCKHCR